MAARLYRAPLLALVCAQLVLVMDGSIVTVALPDIQRGLGLSTAAVQWIPEAFWIPFGGLMLVSGRAGDRYGHHRLLVTGLVALSIASGAATLAPSMAVLVGARLASGAAGAAIASSALALLIGITAAGPDRERALSLNGVAMATGLVSGALVGGQLVALGGWRMPFAAITSAAVATTFSVTRVPSAEEGRPDAVPRMALPNAVALTVGGGAAVGALSLLSRPAAPLVLVAGTGATGAGLLAGFVLLERSPRARLVPDSIRDSRPLLLATAAAGMTSGSFAGMLVVLSLYLRNGLRVPVAEVGALFAAPGISAAVTGTRAAWLIGKVGAMATLRGGTVLMTAAAVALAVTAPLGSTPATAAGAAVSGVGVALALIAATALVASHAAAADQGAAAGTLNTATELGSGIGIALLLLAGAPLASGSLGRAPRLEGAFADAMLVSAALTALAWSITHVSAGTSRGCSAPR